MATRFQLEETVGRNQGASLPVQPGGRVASTPRVMVSVRNPNRKIVMRATRASSQYLRHTDNSAPP